MPGLRLIGTAAEKAGVLSFVLDGQRTEDVGGALDQEGIAVRSGHHCAQPILRRFGLESTVRASLAPYNTIDDVDALCASRSAGSRPGGPPSPVEASFLLSSRKQDEVSCKMDKSVRKVRGGGQAAMRIGIIGGLDRNARDLEAVAEAGGHELETHTGVVAGSSSAGSLRALVARADLVFVLTDVNSHNAVHIARRAARLRHVPLRIVRRLGPSHLAAYLTQVGSVPKETERYARSA